MSARYARVLVDVSPAHLDRPFDYRIPEGVEPGPGSRVVVVFSGRRRAGWVVDVADEPRTDDDRIRVLERVDGDHRWFGPDDLRLYRWVADRYAAPLAAVLRHAFPGRVAAVDREVAGWGPARPPEPAERPPCPAAAWRPYAASPLLKAASNPRGEAFWWRPLPGDDRAAMAADLVARCLAAGRRALVLVPDPASPVPEAALAVAGPSGADLRGDDRSRYRSFRRSAGGHAAVVVGERGAALTPLPHCGLVLVDDEANPAYKERRSPRHHAREVALARARMADATCVLLGDLPSAALWRLLDAGHVRAVGANTAVERKRRPRVDVVDLDDPRPGARRGRLGDAATAALSTAVRSGGAAMVLAARGGEGTAFACRDCRRRRACPVCDGALGAAAGAGDGWVCATCGWSGPAFRCPGCGGTGTAPLRAGAGRLAAELGRAHPRADVRRMEGFDAPGPQRRPAIGVMTRGSVVARPDWLGPRPADVLILPDADALLGRPRFDAGEDALRLWMAAARWADRVVLQTREPRAPAVQALVRWDPEGFWRREAPRRAALDFPPATSLVRLGAAGGDAETVAADVRRALEPEAAVLGPDPQGSLLVKAADLRAVLAALAPLRRSWSRKGLTVRIDVDPV